MNVIPYLFLSFFSVTLGMFGSLFLCVIGILYVSDMLLFKYKNYEA